jgi:hypothetical protein
MDYFIGAIVIIVIVYAIRVANYGARGPISLLAPIVRDIADRTGITEAYWSALDWLDAHRWWTPDTGPVATQTPSSDAVDTRSGAGPTDVLSDVHPDGSGEATGAALTAPGGPSEPEAPPEKTITRWDPTGGLLYESSAIPTTGVTPVESDSAKGFSPHIRRDWVAARLAEGRLGVTEIDNLGAFTFEVDARTIRRDREKLQ